MLCPRALITGSPHSAEQRGCRKSAERAAVRKTGRSPGTVWHFGKSISAINNLIIVRNYRWCVHGDVQLGLFGAEQTAFVISSKFSFVQVQ